MTRETVTNVSQVKHKTSPHSRALGHVSRARIARERCARGWWTRARTRMGVARACGGVVGEKRGGW
jgi:hypothetical protein